MFINYLKTVAKIILVLTITQVQSQAQEEKPNIIIIFADDLGYGDPGSYNPESQILTPHIDSIAMNGMRFTDAHAPGPWCVPSRYGLMTGQYPARIQLNWRERALINPGQPTVASLLKKNGYNTAMVGKWHLGFDNIDLEEIDCENAFRGGPVDHGFNYYYGIHASLDIPPYFYIENDRCVTAPTKFIAENQSSNATTPISGAFWREGKIAPDFNHQEVLPNFTNSAVAFLQQHHQENPNQPFFLYLALAAPHTPWLPSNDFQGKSEAGTYGDFVMQVDFSVGEIMKTIAQLNLGENTLVIFASDNGPVWYPEDEKKYNHESAEKFRGMKMDLWEGGHRVPFLAQWPGKIPPGTVRPDLFTFTDLIATFASIVGDTLPEGAAQDSHNMLPVFLGKELAQPIRNELLISNRVIRDGEWKLIMGSGKGGLSRKFGKDSVTQLEEVSGELYDLNEDISEQENLYDKLPERVKYLQKLLRKYTEDEL